MDSGMEIVIFLAYAGGLLFIFLLANFLAGAGKLILKIVRNGMIGGIVLVTINTVGAFVGVHLPINIVTGVGVGTLGVPGIILLFIMAS